MPATAQNVLQPRKTPVQSRSAASVDAMLEATLQVLVAVGKERLTTTRVAERAGVSVGTLYQYFPNKSSLLQATLRRHFDGVTAAILEVCASERGHTLESMGVELADRFLAAKLTDGKSSVALYAVSSDVDGAEIAGEVRVKMHAAVCRLLATASDGPVRDPETVTAVLLGILSGLSRQLLESPSPQAAYPSYRKELRAVVGAYLASYRRAGAPVALYFPATSMKPSGATRQLEVAEACQVVPSAKRMDWSSR